MKPALKIKELMTLDVCCCHPGDTLERAAGLMWQRDCGCVPVVDEESHVVGMITDRDVCMAAYTRGVALSQALVRDAMSREVYACSGDQPVGVAEKLMQTRQVRRVLVTEPGGKLVGLLSMADIARETRITPGDLKPLSPASFVVAMAAITRPRQALDDAGTDDTTADRSPFSRLC
jgi:CBS domain-containing protein